MTTWLDAPASSCDHEPNMRGTACQHCGLTAELVTPDELTEALMAEVAALRLRAGGQMGWLDTWHCAECGRDYPLPVVSHAVYHPEPTRCWNYLHTLGGMRRCMIRPDYHDGPHEYDPVIVPMGAAR